MCVCVCVCVCLDAGWCMISTFKHRLHLFMNPSFGTGNKKLMRFE